MKAAFLLAMLLPSLALAYAGSEEEPQPATGPDLPDELPGQLDPPSFLESIGIFSMSNTRGERNNNPGNIRISAAPWRGKVAGSDSAFEAFATPQDGIRALAKLLKNYQAMYGLATVRQIIGRYAPPLENDTGSYQRAVAARMGIGIDDRVDLSDPAALQAMVHAVIVHENGRNIYSLADIQTAVNLA